MESVVSAVIEPIDREELIDELTGRGGGLRSSKPSADGLTQYIWRMCRFHAGYDPSMPVTAAWWLQDYLDDHEIDASVSGIVDDAGKQITSALEVFVDALLVDLGERNGDTAQRWQEVGAF